MTTIQIDAKTGAPLDSLPCGTAGRTSWKRLVEILRRAGELGIGEDVVSFEADERGIAFVVETVQEAGRAG